MVVARPSSVFPTTYFNGCFFYFMNTLSLAYYPVFSHKIPYMYLQIMFTVHIWLSKFNVRFYVLQTCSLAPQNAFEPKNYLNLMRKGVRGLATTSRTRFADARTSPVPGRNLRGNSITGAGLCTSCPQWLRLAAQVLVLSNWSSLSWLKTCVWSLWCL